MYATDNFGTGYSEYQSAWAIGAFPPPHVSNNNIQATKNSITVAGFASYSGEDITEAGLIVYELVNGSYNEIARATSADITKQSNDHSGINRYNFNVSVNGLEPDKLYYMRLYVDTDNSGIGYSNYLSFKTKSSQALSVYIRNNEVSTITTTSASIDVIVQREDHGEPEFIERGAVVLQQFPIRMIRFATDSPITVDDNRDIHFPVTVTGLEPGTTYNIKAFVTNTSGTYSSDTVVFSTDSQ